MSSIRSNSTVQDTTLWRKLHSGFGEEEAETCLALSAIVIKACEIATSRIKQFPYYHHQYTLHDQIHLLRVTELMALVLGEEIGNLNPYEISLLILAAHFHDQGMVPESKDLEKIESSDEFEISRKNWELENPNISELRQELSKQLGNDDSIDRLAKKLNSMLDAHRCEFLRQTHGRRSSEIVVSLFPDGGLLTVNEANLAPLLGLLCESHVMSPEALTDENGFFVDQGFSTNSVNLRYLAIILRLADILDFDRDRTPKALLGTVNLTSHVSILEWEKHRSVEGWEIGQDRVRYTLSCEHPVYQKAALDFMDAIDRELASCHKLVDSFPSAMDRRFALNLPVKTDRERISPKNSEYRYFDLEFTMSRDDLVKVLMTDKLYTNNSLFVRELIQNSLDALRYRKALCGASGMTWEEGAISLTHTTDAEGYQMVICSDNGVGMDEEVICNFLTKAGRSFYRSPRFEQERAGFRSSGVDFDPCSKFGIGFMSLFMFGDRIRIQTRRDYGPRVGLGIPLEIEINGLGGLIVIRDGEQSQVAGTTVEITGPRVPSLLDNWTDPVKLCRVTEGYVLGNEFPIEATCDLAGLENNIQIPTSSVSREAFLDSKEVGGKAEFVYDLSKSNPNFGGTIRTVFLTDEVGAPSVSTKEAEFKIEANERGEKKIKFAMGDSVEEYHGPTHDSTVCLDGIVVCGEHGRGILPESRILGSWTVPFWLGDPFMLDVRGALKPEITPARTVSGRNSPWDLEPSWQRLSDLVHQAHADAWEEIFKSLQSKINYDQFWSVVALHQAPIHLMNRELLWSIPQIPISSDGLRFVGLREIPELNVLEVDGKLSFQIDDSQMIAFPTEFGDWGERAIGPVVQVLFRFSELCGIGERSKICLDVGNAVESTEYTSAMSLGPFGSNHRLVKFSNELENLIVSEGPAVFVNRDSPVVEAAREATKLSWRDRTEMERFLVTLMSILVSRDFLSLFKAKEISSGHSLRSLGGLFRAIDWSQISENLSPPYQFATKEKGVVELEANEIERWASFDPIEF